MIAKRFGRLRHFFFEDLTAGTRTALCGEATVYKNFQRGGGAGEKILRITHMNDDVLPRANERRKNVSRM